MKVVNAFQFPLTNILFLFHQGAAFHLSTRVDGSRLWRHLACHACPHRQVLSLKTIFFLLENRWVPPAARSSFISQTYMGGMIGIVLSFPLCGLIITHFGRLGCIFFCLSFSSETFHKKTSKIQISRINVYTLAVGTLVST